MAFRRKFAAQLGAGVWFFSLFFFIFWKFSGFFDGSFKKSTPVTRGMQMLVCTKPKQSPKAKKEEFPSLLEQAKASLEDLRAGRVREV